MPHQHVRLSPACRGACLLALVLTPCVWAQNGAEPERRLNTANGLLNRGLYELAVPEYEAYLNADASPEEARTARYGLGVCLVRLGRFEEAALQLEQVAGDRSFQFAPESQLLLGHSKLALGDLDGAIEAFGGLVKAHPDHSAADDAGALLAESLYRAGRQEEALEAARDVGKRWPRSPKRARAELIGAMAEMSLGKYQDALSQVDVLISGKPDPSTGRQAALVRAQCLHHLNRRKEALAQYESIIADAESPHLADAMLGAAQVHHADGRLDRATALLDTFDKSYSKSPSAPAATLLRARVALDAGDVRTSRRSLEKVGESKDVKLHDDAAYWTAKCDFKEERFARAAEGLEASLATYEKSNLRAEMRYDLGVAQARAGREDAAYEAFEAFRREAPEHALSPDALYAMASIQHRAGRHEECLGLCDQFATTYPQHSSLAGVLFLAGESEFLIGRHDAAASRFERFLSDHAGDEKASLATLRLGLALDRLGRFEEAEAFLVQAAGVDDARFAPAALALGQGYFDLGRWGEAERYLEQYVRSGAEDVAPAQLRLGLARLRDGRAADALSTFDAVIKRSPEGDVGLHASFERAQALYALDRIDEAKRAFELVVEADPDSRFAPHALERLAAIAFDAGDSELAGELYAKAADASPDDAMAARAMFQQVQSLVASGEHEEAAATAEAFAGRYPEHSMSGAGRVLQGMSLARLGRLDDAMEAFGQVDAETRAALAPAMRDSLDYERAYALRALEHTSESVDAYRRVIDEATSPELRAHALLDLAAIEMEAGRFDGAASLLSQVRDLAELVAIPDDVLEATTYRIGVCAQDLDRDAEAVDALGGFASRWPDSDLVPSAGLICAESLIRLGRQGEAISHLKRATEGSPGEDIEAPGLLRLGQCQAALTQWAASEETFKRYLRSFAGSALEYQARFGLAWAVENQGRQREAIAMYQQVVDSHQGPTAARSQFQIGECLFAMGEHDAAVRELLRVDILYDYPEWSAAALYEAGRCFESLKNPDKAREHYEQARERLPESEWANLAAQRLKALTPTALPGRDD